MTIFDDTDFLRDLPPLRQPRKAKPPKVIRTYRHDLKGLYYAARKVMYQRDLPENWRAGHYYDSDFPAIETTNGTQKYIRNVLNWLGHNADRNNTMGIPVVDKKTGEVTWRRSGSTTGATDLVNDIVIPSQSRPCSWKIEVKKGNDKLSKPQRLYKEKMDRIGVLHSIVYVGDLDFFWDEYYRIIKL